MPSAFYGMEIAKSGLFMAQKQLNVTGHNISNANTDGYTRQRIVQQNIDPSFGPNFIAQHKSIGLIGQGVRLGSLDQIRNPYYDYKYREENPVANMWATRATELHYIELKFDTSTDTDILARFNGFKDAINKLSNDRESNVEIRTNVRDQAISMCESFHSMYRQLVETQVQQNDAIEVGVQDMNRIVDSIVNLNKEIWRFELSGQKALDLRDHRNLLMDELSNYVDFDYSYDEEDRLSIKIGDTTLVDHQYGYHLDVQERDDPDEVTGETLYDIIWADDNETPHPDGAEGSLLEFTSGELMGRISLRDGNTAEMIGVPYIIDQLNQLAASLVQGFNEIHESGWTLDDPGNGLASQTGISFFGTNDGESEVTAQNIYISEDILNNIFMIAASTEPVDPTGDVEGTSDVGNNKNALALYELLNSKTAMQDSKSFVGHLEALTVTVAVQAKQSNDNFTVEYQVLSNTIESRASYSGVSLDEEMTSMIKFMHAYKSASRMVTTLDEELDKLINGTGRVGL